jgi:hypothetical protein
MAKMIKIAQTGDLAPATGKCALQRQDRRGDGPAGPNRGAEPDGEGRGG